LANENSMVYDYDHGHDVIWQIVEEMQNVVADALRPRRRRLLFRGRFHSILGKLAPSVRRHWKQILLRVKKQDTRDVFENHGLIGTDLELKHRLMAECADRYKDIAASLDVEPFDAQDIRRLRDGFRDFLDVGTIILGSLLDALNVKSPLLELMELMKLTIKEDDAPAR